MPEKKKFIITIDTEGDNLWNWQEGMPITTLNSRYLDRFQQLCEKYKFKPVWLTNYEMISDAEYVEFIKDVERRNAGELGMHLHAWNTPPDYELSIVQNGQPYLIEYPERIIDSKIEFLTNYIEQKTGIRPTTHRAGRWAINSLYLGILKKYGYTVDCSVTPHIDWTSSPGRSEGAKGCDYTRESEDTSLLNTPYGKILEVPMTVRKTHAYIPSKVGSMKGNAWALWKMICGRTIWMRPTKFNENEVGLLLRKEANSASKYTMFMIHSSELMPGGSPSFPNDTDIEYLYGRLEEIFSIASRYFQGATLREFYNDFMR